MNTNARQLNRVRAVSYYSFFRASVINYCFIVAYYRTCLQYHFFFLKEICHHQLSSVHCNCISQLVCYSLLASMLCFQSCCLVFQNFFNTYGFSFTMLYLAMHSYVLLQDTQNSSLSSWCHVISFYFQVQFSAVAGTCTTLILFNFTGLQGSCFSSEFQEN